MTHRNLAEIVTAPGRTAAMAQQKIRAPFAGTLVELKVADGDTVHRGDTLGYVASRESEAALAGAREMVRDAKTPAEKRDAERAIALAERGLVRAALRSSADGAVLAHAATAGDRVSEEQEILTIADAASIVFLADVGQSDLARVRPGQAAAVELAGRARPVSGIVHAVLPAANAADFTFQARVDLKGMQGLPPVGLFGTARITVGERRNAAVVPDAAVLRDDVTGAARVAVVRGGKARWIDVTSGVRSDGVTEILSPTLAADEPVIVGGQVGLPDGAAVAIRP
ncbi:MAG TPA: efflux RND transporter periplasmic adaptor subunit [Thermoanaerobaculia bacterium]|nr:efflux RND transporter periplasmic adaptor subunit [Thermoanaerobaculia bacterium]